MQSTDYELLDAADPLKDFREQFIIPVINGKEQVYFLGNSLGLQPRTASWEISNVLDQWAMYGVEGFFTGDKPWLEFHEQLKRPLASIVGAFPDEISVMNQLTVNLHLMMVTFYRPNGKRKKIICEAKAFPSDQYMFETHLKSLGLDPEEVVIEVHPRRGEQTIRDEDIFQTIDQHRDEIALILWGGLNYYTGQAFDLKAVTKAGHDAGAMVGFDLAHAAGNIPLQLHDWNVDFACWCNYKYLNAGPGAVGAVFINEQHHRDESLHRFAGWWGYDLATRFQMEKGFKPIQSAEGWQLSTPSMLLYATLKASLDIFANAGIKQLHEKRRKLNAYLHQTLQHVNASLDEPIIEFITPINQSEPGCQVSLFMKSRGREIYDGLMQAGFIVDWREPSVIRLAPVPLYNTFAEIAKFGEHLQTLITTH
ncbi:MAG: kynureninase [Chitinophagaceae bacterium]|nr:kynureninase [Chitinophagaceae bacterium]